jgi:uncharacterized protein YbjT (DUF2867 family)
MSTQPVLVTGAAGGTPFGSTGAHVAELLLQRGTPVRAFVRSDDDRAAALRAKGADVVVGDMRDLAAVDAAMAGVRRVFFTFPVEWGLLDAAGVFAVAARRHRIEQLVEVSMLVAAPDGRTPRMRQHWVCEQLFDWAGIGAVHLRSSVFNEMVVPLTMGPPDARQFLVPLGESSTFVPLVGARDVAGVAAGILSGEQPIEPGFLRLVGDKATVASIVKDFTEVVGEPLEYVDPGRELWRAGALELGLTEHAVDHLSDLWVLFSSDSPDAIDRPVVDITDTIERYTGRTPETLRDFLAENREALRARP